MLKLTINAEISEFTLSGEQTTSAVAEYLAKKIQHAIIKGDRPERGAANDVTESDEVISRASSSMMTRYSIKIGRR